MLSLFTNNPELKRNSWLELKTNRLIVMPVLLALAYLITISLSSGSSLLSSLRGVSIAAFHILITVWGSKQTADSIASEINEKTWDRQRMTGLDPWKMVVGKLFGSTLYQWYGASIAMAVYFFACFGSDEFGTNLYTGAITIATGLFVNAFALLISLLNITGNSFSSFSNTKINTTFFYILALIMAYQINMVIFIPTFSVGSFLKWYGLVWNKIASFLSVIVFISWAIMGIYRNLRTELQYKNKATAWSWFLVFAIVFSFGFSINPIDRYNFLDKTEQALTTSWVMFLKLNVVTYVLISILSFLILFERKSLFEYNIFRSDLKAFNFKKLQYSAPLWFITSVVAIVFLLILSVTSFLLPYSSSNNYGNQFFSIINKLVDNKPSTLFFTYICVIFLIVRDILLTRYVVYFTGFKNKNLAIILYLVIVYMALPTLFKAADFSLFLPYATHENIIVPFISLFSQALGATLLYRFSFNKLK